MGKTEKITLDCWLPDGINNIFLFHTDYLINKGHYQNNWAPVERWVCDFFDLNRVNTNEYDAIDTSDGTTYEIKSCMWMYKCREKLGKFKIWRSQYWSADKICCVLYGLIENYVCVLGWKIIDTIDIVMLDFKERNRYSNSIKKKMKEFEWTDVIEFSDLRPGVQPAFEELYDEEALLNPDYYSKFQREDFEVEWAGEENWTGEEGV